jgi:hypothetical protein
LTFKLDVASLGEQTIASRAGDGSNGSTNPISGNFVQTFDLPAGNHTLEFIGELSSKDYTNEDFYLEIDDVRIDSLLVSTRLPERYEIERSPDGSGSWTTLLPCTLR